jgi:hypothetical protein
MSTELFILCLGHGAALAFALPSGVKLTTKFEPNTEAEFKAYLRRKGLK